MQNISFNRTIVQLFVLSYRCLLRNLRDKPDFLTWCRLRVLYDRKISRIVFSSLPNAGPRADPHRNQQLYYDIHHLFVRHLPGRLKLFAFAQRFGSSAPSVFVAAALLKAWVDALIRMAASVARGQSIVAPSGLKPGSSVVLAISFPAHGYAIRPQDQMSPAVFGSFAELLRADLAGSADEVIAVGTYERRSKRREAAAETPGAAILPVLHATARRSFADTAGRFGIALLGGLRSVFSLRPLYHLERTLSVLRGHRFFAFLRDLERARVDVRRIYVMPYDDLGELRTRPGTRSKLVNVNYSSNVFLPPIDRIDDGRTPLPLPSYYLSGDTAGFVEIYDLIDRSRQAMTARYGCPLPVDKRTRRETPMGLGFETTATSLDVTGPMVVVFDVPPHPNEKLLGAWAFGDRSSDFDINAQFIRRIAAAGAQRGLRVVLKPKYSLTNYEQPYRDLLEGLRAEHGARFAVASPYDAVVPLIERAAGAVSYPYTSTQRIAAALGKPSIYYFPPEYRSPIFDAPGRYADIAGEAELDGFFRALGGAGGAAR